MTRAAIYARVSRDDESDILENQVRDLRELAARHGYSIVREYVEIRSGTDDGRAEFGRMLSDASLQRGRPWDVLLLRSLSRATRGGTGAALDLLRQLQGFGVGWRFLDTPILDSTADTPELVRNVLLAIVAELDAEFRRNVSRKTKAAYARRLALAKANGTAVRWGRPRKAPPPHADGTDPPTAPGEMGAIS